MTNVTKTYNDLSLAEVTDLCRKLEIATLSNNRERTPLSPHISRIPVLLNYFGNSKSNAFNDILAFDLLRTIAPRGSGKSRVWTLFVTRPGRNAHENRPFRNS